MFWTLKCLWLWLFQCKFVSFEVVPHLYVLWFGDGNCKKMCKMNSLRCNNIISAAETGTWLVPSFMIHYQLPMNEVNYWNGSLVINLVIYVSQLSMHVGLHCNLQGTASNWEVLQIVISHGAITVEWGVGGLIQGLTFNY